jgi:hypothetical protein
VGGEDLAGGEVGGGDAAVVGEARTLLRAWVVPMPRWSVSSVPSAVSYHPPGELAE